MVKVARVKRDMRVRDSFMRAQLGKDILSIDASDVTCHLLMDLGQRHFTSIKKASPREPCWFEASICTLTDRYAFITGGNARTGFVGKDSVQRFDIMRNIWQRKLISWAIF